MHWKEELKGVDVVEEIVDSQPSPNPHHPSQHEEKRIQVPPWMSDEAGGEKEQASNRHTSAES
jgi:hypothetical protein